MCKLICEQCKTELTPNNIKDIQFGRVYEMVDGVEIDTEYAYIECSNCGNTTETDEGEGYALLLSMSDMNLNDATKEEADIGEQHIECPSCHNKILGKYLLNVKKKCCEHCNSGDYEEETYTGECPICGEIIEDSKILDLHVDSVESVEYELRQYYTVMAKLGYSLYPFADCEYSDTSAEEELKYLKNALNSLTDTLNLHYLYNIYNITGIQTGKLYDYCDKVIHDIFENTDYVDFNIDSLKDCKFRILNSSILNDEIEEDVFDTPFITLLLQVNRNNKILGYIEVSQQYPLDTKFTMQVVKKDSNIQITELCKFYTNIYKKENTPKIKTNNTNSEFDIPVCKKCGQLFCDCNLRCKICGKVFCECNKFFSKG